MTASLAIGLRLHGPGGTAVIVIRAPEGPVALTCAGVPMSESPLEQSAESTEEVAIGKRYADEVRGLELLVTKGGPGPLAVEGVELAQKQPKRLPASD